MIIAALKNWAVTTRELMEQTGTTEDGTDLSKVAKTLRAYGLQATYRSGHLSFQKARDLLWSGHVLIASVMTGAGIPHAIVVSGVRSDGSLLLHDPSPAGLTYRRFFSEYVVTKVPQRVRRNVRH